MAGYIASYVIELKFDGFRKPCNVIANLSNLRSNFIQKFYTPNSYIDYDIAS